MKTRLYFLALAITITQYACTQQTTLPQLPPLTKVEILKSKGGLVVKTISDRAQVKAIETFFNQNRKGWEEAFLGGGPAGEWGVDLYSGTNCCARYGLAQDCLVSDTLINRSTQQRAELLRLIGDLPKTLSEVVLPGISNITDIVVMTNFTTDRIIRRITDPQRISQIIAIVNRHRSGWETNWFGQPMPNVILKLRNKDGFVVEFCAGPDFLVRCEDEQFMNITLKHVKKLEADEILNLTRGP